MNPGEYTLNWESDIHRDAFTARFECLWLLALQPLEQTVVLEIPAEFKACCPLGASGENNCGLPS